MAQLSLEMSLALRLVGQRAILINLRSLPFFRLFIKKKKYLRPSLESLEFPEVGVQLVHLVELALRMFVL